MDAEHKDAFDFVVTLVFIFVAMTLLFPLNMFIPVDRRMGTLLGAVLCMLIIWVTPTYSRINIGEKVDFSVLIILTAIMAINFVLLRQSWVRRWTASIQNMIREDVNRGFYAVSLISLLASPFITNDGLCLMLVHPVLDAFRGEKQSDKLPLSKSDSSQRICPTDALFFMLNIACSSNIGSALTYTGNPQNIIVANSLGKYMSGGVFCLLMVLPTAASWGICIPLLNYYRRRAAEEYARQGSQELELQPMVVIETISPLAATVSTPQLALAMNQRDGRVGDTESAALSTADDLDDGGPAEPSVRKALGGGGWDVITAPYIVFTALAVVMILEFTGAVPLAGLFAFAAVVVVVGVILRNYYGAVCGAWWAGRVEDLTVAATEQRLQTIKVFLEQLFHDIDYNLLIIFIGLFVVSGAFLLTEIPQALWDGVAGDAAFTTSASTFFICVYIVLACQLIGNVPVVFMAVESMDLLPRRAQVMGWLMMAFVSTVAGNFTLVGSAANIIVAEKAMRHKHSPLHIDAVRHFKYCGGVTVMCIAVGALILAAEAQLFL